MCRHGAGRPGEISKGSQGLSLCNTKQVLQPRRSAAARILRQMRQGRSCFRWRHLKLRQKRHLMGRSTWEVRCTPAVASVRCAKEDTLRQLRQDGEVRKGCDLRQTRHVRQMRHLRGNPLLEGVHCVTLVVCATWTDVRGNGTRSPARTVVPSVALG